MKRGAVVHAGGFEFLVIAVLCVFHGSGQQLAHLAGVHRLEILHDLQVLLEHLHAVNAGDHDRCWKREGVGQALFGGGDLVLDDSAACHRFHAQNSNSLLNESGHNIPGEAAEIGIEHIEWHLARVEMELVLARYVKHAMVDDRVFVARKTCVSDLAGFLCLLESFDSTALGEAAICILHAQVLVDLHQIDVVRLQPLKRFVNLCGGGLPCTSVDLGHQKHFGTVAIAQGLAHPYFALTVMVIPAVIHEGDAEIDGRANQVDAVLLFFHEPNVVATHAQRAYPFSGTPECPVEHVAHSNFFGNRPEVWNCKKYICHVPSIISKSVFAECRLNSHLRQSPNGLFPIPLPRLCGRNKRVHIVGSHNARVMFDISHV